MKQRLIRMITIAEKEWLQIRRDTRSLVLALFVPSLLVLLFGYALNVDVKHVRIGIYDQDKSALSRAYIEKLSHTEYLRLEKTITKQKEIDRLIDSGEISLAVVIPVSFEKDYKSGKTAKIQLLVDGSDSTTASIAGGYIGAITYSMNRALHTRDLKKKGIQVSEPLDVRTRIWYNPELKSKNFIIPGLIVLILAIISALITSLTISREWERGTMESLISTPVRAGEVVAGKLVPYLLIGVFDVIFALSLGYFVFDVPFKGSFAALILLSVLFLAGTSGLGIFISSATRVQVLSVQFSIVATYLPSFILSDFIFPIKNMPIFIQGLTYIVPAKYLVAILKSLALKGVSVTLLWTQILFLGIFTAGILVLSVKKFSVVLPDK